MENPIKLMILGYPYFRKTFISVRVSIKALDHTWLSLCLVLSPSNYWDSFTWSLASCGYWGLQSDKHHLGTSGWKYRHVSSVIVDRMISSIWRSWNPLVWNCFSIFHERAGDQVTRYARSPTESSPKATTTSLFSHPECQYSFTPRCVSRPASSSTTASTIMYRMGFARP